MADMDEYLIGVRLRATAQADDYRVGDLDLHVGDLVLVETITESVVGEVRRAKREIPEMKKDRAYRRGVRAAAPAGGPAPPRPPARGESAGTTPPPRPRRRRPLLEGGGGRMHPG